MPMVGPTTDHYEIQHWADAHSAIPTEILPSIVDGEPTQIRLVLGYSPETHPERRQITWNEFFLKFDQLGLALVYDDDSTGRNELLQIEAKSPYRNEKYRSVPVEN